MAFYWPNDPTLRLSTTGRRGVPLVLGPSWPVDLTLEQQRRLIANGWGGFVNQNAPAVHKAASDSLTLGEAAAVAIATSKAGSDSLTLGDSGAVGTSIAKAGSDSLTQSEIADLLAHQVWPVIDPSLNATYMGSSYAPLAYPAVTAIRYIDAQNGNDANAGTSWGAAWKGLYNAWETAISNPGGGAIEIWCRGEFDLTDINQYFPSSGQLLIGNVIDGTATAPRIVRGMPGASIIKGWITLRTPNYNRFSGFVMDGYDLVSDQALKIESASATAHFEHSYNTYRRYKDQAVIIETGLGTDFHGYNNLYEYIGNYRHPDGTRGHFDQPIYVKKCPRYLEVNPIFQFNIGGYGLHAYDSVTGDPANAGRLLHATGIGHATWTESATINSGTIDILTTNGPAPRAGMVVTGPGIPSNTQIDSVSGSTLTMSASMTPGSGTVTLAIPSSGGVVDSGDNFVVANSIFAFHQGVGVNSTVMGKPFRWINSPSGGEFRRNLYYGNTNGLDLAGLTETSSLTSDPLLANVENAAAGLQAGSPALGSGEGFGVLVDHKGRTRSTSAPSRGALEA